ncbi:Integrin alpha-7 [Myotis davidii]|uniref:Integrin alpha-7 n=1 Tax=Myotis davidii TaxID=225400 RepID=L5LNY7_MYODS|nr:Integrin alpha-7 [Myotis davidii]
MCDQASLQAEQTALHHCRTVLWSDDCARGTANCVLFSCPLYSFDRAAVLHVWGRLWNSTFLEVRG